MWIAVSKANLLKTYLDRFTTYFVVLDVLLVFAQQLYASKLAIIETSDDETFRAFLYKGLLNE